MSALLVALAVPPLWSWFHRLERSDRGATVVMVVWAVLLLELALYPNQNTVPAGLFHPAVGSFSFRLLDVVVLVALGARLSTHGLGRFRATGLLWAAFLTWLGVAAVIGLAGGNSIDKLTFEGKAIVYLGAMLLTAGVPARKLLERDQLPRLIKLTAVLAGVLLVTNVAGIRFDLGAHPAASAEAFPGESVSPAGELGPDAATIFVALGVIAIGLALYAPTPAERAKLALAAAPLLASPVGPAQRAAFLGLAMSLAALILLAALWGRKPRATPTELGLAALALLAMVILPTLIDTVRSEDAPQLPLESDLAYSFSSRAEQLTTQDRLNQWEVAGGLVAERPVFGWGLGKEYEYFEPGRFEFLQVDVTHNIVLDLLLRTGVVGLGLFLAALGATLARGLRAFRRARDGMVAALSLGLIAAIVGFLSKGMVESIFEKYRLAIAFALLIGMLLSAASLEEDDEPAAGEPERERRPAPEPVPA